MPVSEFNKQAYLAPSAYRYYHIHTLSRSSVVVRFPYCLTKYLKKQDSKHLVCLLVSEVPDYGSRQGMGERAGYTMVP